MASLAEIQSLLEQIKADLPALINRSQIAPRQVVIVNGLSDISERLGLVQAGEFRSGNSKEPGYGFSGVRIGYPAFAYGGDTWNIVGINNDSLQVGIRSSDGKLFAGGGDVILDNLGIFIKNNQEAALAFEDTSGGRSSIYIVSGLSNELALVNLKTDGEIVLRQLLTGDTSSAAHIRMMEDAGHAGRLYVNLSTGNTDEGVTLSVGKSESITLLAGGTAAGANYIRMYGGFGTSNYPTPDAPSNNGFLSDTHIYVKGGKLIFQYNDAGTVRYKYLDLTGIGVTWTHTTTAP